MDLKSIATEEELLAAERKTIDEKKNTRKVILREMNRGNDTLTFAFAPEKADGEETQPDGEDPETKPGEKDFKQKQKVIVQASKSGGNELEGTVLSSEAGESVTVQLEKKYAVTANENAKFPSVALRKDGEYFLSYDYQVEEIIWNKQVRALKELKNGNTQIPNFLRKITRPQEFIKNDLVAIGEFFDKELDENQKLAVQKSLSLSAYCEVLVLQGPAGNGENDGDNRNGDANFENAPERENPDCLPEQSGGGQCARKNLQD